MTVKQTHEYKIITQADKFFGDAFDPYKLQTLLNDLAAKGWRLTSAVSGDFGDWTTALTGSKRGQVLFVLERPFVDTGLQPGSPPPDESREADAYDAEKIPKNRWYASAGNVSTMMKNAGLVTAKQLDIAREHFAKRGGHLCDHLLALGYISEESLRELLGKKA